MKTIFRMFAPALVIIWTCGASFAAEATVTGELVDVECYTKDSAKNVGIVHQDCATMCAMKGQAVAVVTDEGEVYRITGDLTGNRNAMLAPHMSHRVAVTGDVSVKDGHKVIEATKLTMAGPRFTR